jgi:putative nucleotidyltransferase with HDIG domain
MKSREEAVVLLAEYTKSESLIKHALTVEAAMLWYARHFECPPEEHVMWGVTGLLHDFDYERFPDPTPESGHPFIGVKMLREQGYPEEVCSAILGHALYTGVPRETLLAKTLFAVDELCGLVTASALVRPDSRYEALNVKSVKKKFKDKAFAKGCSRDDIRLGTEELEIDLDSHIANVISALTELEQRNPEFRL